MTGSDFGVRIQHAGIHVKNIEETAKWYHDIFGFELDPGQQGGSMAGMFPQMRWLSLGDFKLEVYEVPDAGEFSVVDMEYTQ